MNKKVTNTKVQKWFDPGSNRRPLANHRLAYLCEANVITNYTIEPMATFGHLYMIMKLASNLGRPYLTKTSLFMHIQIDVTKSKRPWTPSEGTFKLLQVGKFVLVSPFPARSHQKIEQAMYVSSIGRLRINGWDKI